MKAVKQFVFLLALVCSVNFINAQEFKVPANYKLKTEADYKKCEKDVINCVNWLESTIGEGITPQRKEANAFLLEWITGSPNVTVEMNADIINFTEKNPDLLMIFMGGWTRFVLENPGTEKDMVKGNLAGIKSVISVYKKGEGVKKDPALERLVKLDTDGTLEKWVQDRLKK